MHCETYANTHTHFIDIKLPKGEKARVKQIQKWLKITREGGVIRGKGRPKDSNSQTTDESVTAVENFGDATGFAVQVCVWLIVCKICIHSNYCICMYRLGK